MQKPVVVLGDLVVDHIIQVQSLPIVASQHQRIRHSEQQPGGSGNTLIAGARMGLAMQSLGAVGQDREGQFLIETLAAEGVHTSGIVRVVDGSTRIVYLLIAADGLHVFLGYQGLRGPTELSTEWAQAIKNASVLFFDGWAYVKDDPDVLLQAAQQATKHQVPVYFDPGPAYGEFDQGWLKETLNHTHTLLLTQDEAKGMLQTDADPIALGKALLSRGPKRVFIKQGQSGLSVISEQEIIEVPGLDVKARDTTGAGDVVAAAVLYGTQRGFALQKIATFANAAGAAMVQKIGTGTHVPIPSEISELLPEGDWFV